MRKKLQKYQENDGVSGFVLKRFGSINSTMVASLVFRSPMNKIVIAGSNERIIIYDLITYNELQSVRLKGEINSMIKWTDHTLLCSSRAGKIIHYSVEEKEPHLTTIKEFPNLQLFVDKKESKGKNVGQILKLQNDLFMCCNHEGDVYTVNYITEDFDFFPNRQKFAYSDVRKLLLSQRFDNCVWINSEDEENTIKLLNYKTKKEELGLTGHKDYIYTITNFLNSKKEEIIIGGGTSKEKMLFFYNSSIKDPSKRLILSLEREVTVKCSSVFQIGIIGRNSKNKYLYVGCSNCDLFLYDLKNTSENDKFGITKLLFFPRLDNIGDAIRTSCVAKQTSSTAQILIVPESRDDGRCFVVQFNGLNLADDSVSEMDRNERIEFLKVGFREVISNEGMEKKVFFKICLNNCKLEKILKSLLI